MTNVCLIDFGAIVYNVIICTAGNLIQLFMVRSSSFLVAENENLDYDPHASIRNTVSWYAWRNNAN